jgi:predicted metal-dependent hydrolase
MKSGERRTIDLQGRAVDYRIVRSKTARHLRVRVGLNGVEVVQPYLRGAKDAADFLRANGNWVSEQLHRVEKLRGIRQPQRKGQDQILFRGRAIPIRIETVAKRSGNKIVFNEGQIVLHRGTNSQTPLARSLENWLREQARREIERLVVSVSGRLKRSPRRVYVMGQRTKWGNCSSKKNLSFNWRLVLAPEFVLRYFVAHEVVHLAQPNHSSKFWLTLQSICPETQQAKQWLRTNGQNLMVDLERVCGKAR